MSERKDTSKNLTILVNWPFKSRVIFKYSNPLKTKVLLLSRATVRCANTLNVD